MSLPRRHAQREALRQRWRDARSLDKQEERSEFHLNTSLSTSDEDSDRDAPSGKTAEYYQQKIAEFKEAGPVISNLGDATLKTIAAEQGRWNTFCAEVQFENPQKALLEAKAEHYKAYLLWRLKNSRIKKESALVILWLTMSMFYTQSAQRYMDGGILYDIRNWIRTYLTPQFNLDVSEKRKGSLFVEDLCVLQNGHWVRDKEVFPHERLRLQVSAILILGACTATRPGALIGQVPLEYNDLEFQVFPSPDQGKRPIVVLVLNLENVKRASGKQKPKKYAFYEGENLICCPVLFTLSLALSDNAFKNKFTSLDQIYRLVIPNGTDRIRLKWDDEWVRRPVFRDVQSTGHGIRLSNTKALTYAKHRNHFVRLGLTCGFRERLEFYDLRRASGKKLNEALTPEERKQIMGHRSNVYERHYMPSFIDRDCQAIYLGTTRRDDLVRAIGRLERHDLAPSHLTDAQNYEISIHPDVIALVEARERCKKKVKGLGLTRQQATEMPSGKKWKALNAEINALKESLRRQRLKEIVNDFHESEHTLEVDRQLQGIPPSSEILTPSTIEYEIEDRAIVTKLLFQPLDELDDDQVHQVRIQLVESLVLLSKRQETPRSLKNATRPRIQYVTASTSHQEDRSSSHTEQEDIALLEDCQEKLIGQPTRPATAKNRFEGLPLFCAFCKWQDSEASQKKKNRIYSRKDCLARHIRLQHLQYLDVGEGLYCPQQGCSAFLANSEHYLSHTARQHGLFL